MVRCVAKSVKFSEIWTDFFSLSFFSSPSLRSFFPVWFNQTGTAHHLTFFSILVTWISACVHVKVVVRSIYTNTSRDPVLLRHSTGFGFNWVNLFHKLLAGWCCSDVFLSLLFDKIKFFQPQKLCLTIPFSAWSNTTIKQNYNWLHLYCLRGGEQRRVKDNLIYNGNLCCELQNETYLAIKRRLRVHVGNQV